MRPMLLIAAACLLMAQASPEADIRALLMRQQQDWNKGDVRAFMTGYEASSATTFLGDKLTRGYQQVLDRYIERYPARDNMGTLEFSELEVRMLGADHASVLGRYRLTRTAAGGGDAAGRFTLILKKTPVGWRIIHDHTTAGAE
ncbi:MAG: DUF4440 domain-containing protein [Bryobacteraceae bacterium]